MNLWLLTSEYPPDYGGGIATYSYHTAQMLRRRGHEITIFAAAENQPGYRQVEQTPEGIRVVRFGANQSPHSSALGDIARLSYDGALAVAEFCRKEGAPDLLEIQEYLGMPYFLLQRHLTLEDGLTDIPILVTAHTPLYICRKYDQLPTYRFPGYWIGEMERYSLQTADEVVFPSQYMRYEIEKDFPQITDHSRVIANPYQAEEEVTGQAVNLLRHGFLFTAKLERRKGIDALLSTFSHAWDTGLDESLYLLGDDWYDELNQCKMSEMISKRYKKYFDSGLLIWEGKQPPQVVKQRLNQVRALILPSLVENLPYAVIEAMAGGCPVVVSQSGGHAEIVEDGMSGFIFSHQKAGDLEEKIQIIRHLTPSEYNRITSSAQARVKQVCGYDVIGPQKEEAIEWACEQVHPKKYYPFLHDIKRSKERTGEKGMLGEAGLLSIVIPFFNMGDYLEDTVKPFEDLKDVPFEILVMDDGSDDQRNLDKLEELKNQYHFNVEHAGNQGLALMRNIGAGLAKGEYIAFLDADDVMDPTFYRQAIKIFHQYENVSFVGCWAEYFSASDGYWPTWTPEPPYALVHNPINTSGLIYRRADFLRYGLNDPTFEHVMEDYDSLLSMLENGCRGVVLPDPYFKYRVRSDSMFHSTTDMIKIWTYHRLALKHRRLYSPYAEEILAITVSNGPGYLYDNPTLWYPVVGYENETGSPALGKYSGIDLPQLPARILMYYVLRSVLIRPYGKLRSKFPWLKLFVERTKKALNLD